MKHSRKTPDRGVPSTGPLNLEVEPLGDARWARVERAVLDAPEVRLSQPNEAPRAALDAAPPRWRLAAGMLVLAGALAAIAGGFAWHAWLPESRATPTRVETAANGSRVEFGEATIEVGPTSAVRFAGDDAHGVVVTLDNGRVECDVAPRHGRPPFVVEAGSVEVRVVGTHFVVARAGGEVTVDVQRGQVEVTADGQPSLVSAGSHWPASPGTTPDVAASAGSTAPTATGRETGAGHALPVESRPSASSQSSQSSSSQSSQASPTSPSSRPEARAAALLTPHEQYDAASKLEAHQPVAAIAQYRELAREGGAWGENALFAAGRLEADRGDPASAQRLLGEYLARYPSGPNANDARQLLDRLR